MGGSGRGGGGGSGTTRLSTYACLKHNVAEVTQIITYTPAPSQMSNLTRFTRGQTLQLSLLWHHK